VIVALEDYLEIQVQQVQQAQQVQQVISVLLGEPVLLVKLVSLVSGA